MTLHLSMLTAATKKLVYTLFLVWSALSAASQQSREYSFKHLSLSQGLASNITYSIVQDAEGYIWIATNNGLQRYDGNSFITFRHDPKNPASVPSDEIRKLFLDRKNRLWVITNDNKAGIFDTKKFQCRTVSWNRAFDIATITVQELHDGSIISQDPPRNTYLFDEKNFVFRPDSSLLPLLKGWPYKQIFWDEKIKKYWIGSDTGLILYNPAKRTFSYRNHNVENDPVIRAFENVTYIFNPRTDAKGNFIMQSWRPGTGAPIVYKFDRSKQVARQYHLSHHLPITYHEIFGLLQQRNGRLWIHGLPFVAEWVDDDQVFRGISNAYTHEQSIKFDYAYQMYEDREGSIWIATDNGVFVFNPDRQIFNTYGLVRPGEKPKDAPVHCIAETSDGRIYVGVWGTGLFCYDQNFEPIELPPGMNPKGKTISPWDMTVHPVTDQLWITQQGGLISVWDHRKNSFTEYAPEIFAGATIRQIDDDTTGNLWFGTQKGKLIKWDFKKSGGDPAKGYELVFETGLITKVHYDYQGFIWVASEGRGVYKIDARTHQLVKHFAVDGKEGEKLFGFVPTDMTYYNDSTLVIAAGYVNILNKNRNTITYLSTADGLPANSAVSIQKDQGGIIWAGMKNGICRINLKTKSVTYYDRRSGLPYDKFSWAAVQHLKDGRIVFGNDHNFVVLDPKKFIENNIPPKPYITGFKLAGKDLLLDSLLSGEQVVLQHNNTSIAINFSALSYLQQRKLHFYYKLDGIDKDWVHVDQPTEVIYNYLPPGGYVFLVKSQNSDGMPNPDIASLRIEVRPPFWRTWWFYSLVALIVALVLYIVDRERMKRLRSLQHVRTQIAGSLHEEINTALSNINVLSEIAKIKADRDVAQSKEFIDQISTRSRYMMESMDDILWSIHPENDSMKQTLHRIRELSENLHSAHAVDIDLIVDHKLYSLELDMRLRHNLYFYYKEAIQFLLTNYDCSQVFVNFNLRGQVLAMEIISEGSSEVNVAAAFQKQVQKRVEEMQGELDTAADAKTFSAVLTVRLA